VTVRERCLLIRMRVTTHAHRWIQEALSGGGPSHIVDRLDVTFDDDHAVADAGLVPPATLLEHLDVEASAEVVSRAGTDPVARS
jgi:hypothetical protein